MTNAVGMDVSKAFFDAFVAVGKAGRHHQFPNSEKGVEALLLWCEKWKVTEPHFCMEATGSYSSKLAKALHQKNFQVSVVNPYCIRKFAQSKLRRTKTDKLDAKIIAEYCESNQPRLWQPVPPEMEELQTLVRRLYDLTKMRTQELNRSASNSFADSTMRSVKRMLAFIDDEMKKLERRIERLYQQHAYLRERRDLLLSVPGVGDITANVVLAEVPSIDMFMNAKQLVAFAGLSPEEKSSGSSIRGKQMISKKGRTRLRSVLYWPAVSASMHNPIIKSFCERLESKGKPRMKVLTAAMRKLLHIIFGVLKSGKPFSAKFATDASHREWCQEVATMS